MFPTARYNSEASRFTPHSDVVDFEGFDFTGAAFKMEIRDRKNGGELRAEITPTVTVTFDDDLPTSHVAWTIPEATMRDMPLAPQTDADVVLFRDLHITPVGLPKFVAFEGTFTVKAGVTE